MIVEPIDELHAECIADRAEVRAAFEALRSAVSVWEPAPFDPDKAIPFSANVAAILRSRARPDVRVYYGDDPLLIRDRRWLR